MKNLVFVLKRVLLFWLLISLVNIESYSQNETDSIMVYYCQNRNHFSWQQDPSDFYPESELKNKKFNVIKDKNDIRKFEKRVLIFQEKQIKYFASDIKCIAYKNGNMSYYLILGSNYKMYKNGLYYKPDNKITKILSKYIPHKEFIPRRCFVIRFFKRLYYKVIT